MKRDLSVFPISKNVASRVFTRKTAPPTGGNVFQRTRTTFKLNQHIIRTNILTNFKLDRDIIGTTLLTKFHESRKRNVPSGTDDGQRLVTKAHPSNQINILTKFHKDWMKTVTSTVYTNKLLTELINILTKFHKDWMKTVTATVYTSVGLKSPSVTSSRLGAIVSPPVLTGRFPFGPAGLTRMSVLTTGKM
ncbi:hypothetical protein DPMN_011566 [Dreissena polymorpha]|uniref:Uncharacterized protein n=1 Tax=Dreissena polymorpha TaxID=45954 RepID=A0A9D4S051_DREPO|nr:hypothetical protein DPMN_011566 [Dreissena polymorpha]